MNPLFLSLYYVNLFLGILFTGITLFDLRFLFCDFLIICSLMLAGEDFIHWRYRIANVVLSILLSVSALGAAAIFI